MAALITHNSRLGARLDVNNTTLSLDDVVFQPKKKHIKLVIKLIDLTKFLGPYEALSTMETMLAVPTVSIM